MVWVFGGLDLTPAVKQDVWSSLDGISWTNTGNMPAVRDNMAATVYANKMWLVGGLNGGGVNQTTVWNTTDGISFTVATAAYGGSALSGAQLVAHRTPDSVSTINAYTLWLVGGAYAASFTNNIYRGNINTALPASFTPSGTGATTTEQWQFTTQNLGAYLILKNTADAWIYYAGVLQQITDSNYPTSTVPGVENLDDTVYVMDSKGVIYGTALSTPFTWPANNYITADFESDTGVRLTKYKSLLVALKSTTTQFFRDAGRYPGSPLLPSTQYNMRIGCISAASVVKMLDTVVWMARGEDAQPYICYLTGPGTVQRISTPAVERLLRGYSASAQDNATSLRMNGHDWYILTLTFLPFSLIYDFAEQEWFIAQDPSGSYWKASNYVSDGTLDYFQMINASALAIVTPVTYQDNNVTFTATILLPRLDDGNNMVKFHTAATVIGDRRVGGIGTSNITLSWSDDDTLTFTTGSTVDLAAPRPRFTRLGSFYRRNYRLQHSSNNSMRLEALEVEFIDPSA
jgi:hypothetical protein